MSEREVERYNCRDRESRTKIALTGAEGNGAVHLGYHEIPALLSVTSGETTGRRTV